LSISLVVVTRGTLEHLWQTKAAMGPRDQEGYSQVPSAAAAAASSVRRMSMRKHHSFCHHQRELVSVLVVSRTTTDTGRNDGFIFTETLVVVALVPEGEKIDVLALKSDSASLV
jgi:hypothetical protein